MKFLYILLLVFFSGNLFGQKIEISTMYGINQLRDAFGGNSGYFSAEYDIGSSFIAGVGMGELKFVNNDEPLSIDFMLNFFRLKGHLRMSDGGHGGSKTVEMSFSKHILNLEFYPIHFELINKRLKFSLGAEYSRTVSAKISGSKRTWKLLGAPSVSEFDSSNISDINMNRIALNAKASFKWPLFDGFYLIPNVVYTRGFANEYRVTLEKVYLSALRIGFNIRLKNNEKNDSI